MKFNRKNNIELCVQRKILCQCVGNIQIEIGIAIEKTRGMDPGNSISIPIAISIPI